MPQHGAAVGIDLGSSSCRIGLWRDGDVLIVPNDRGFFFSQKWGRIFSMCAYILIECILYIFFLNQSHRAIEEILRDGCWMKMIWKGYEKKT